MLASFSKLKYVNSKNFIRFRQFFQAEFKGGFIVPAETFDNVNGSFPIGFLIWNTGQKQPLREIYLDVFDKNGRPMGQKGFYAEDSRKRINEWYKLFYDYERKEKAIMNTRGNDFQNQPYIRITSTNNYNHTNIITEKNVFQTCVYFAVRHAVSANWLNDRDQFYYPDSAWAGDWEFQCDCLAFTLFHGQNRVTSRGAINHFIPFSEEQIGARESFASDFMYRFLRDGREIKYEKDDMYDEKSEMKKIEFSPEAQDVFQAGRDLFAYYHARDFAEGAYNVNASLYDIKEFFQGRTPKGKMKTVSGDARYNELMSCLREALGVLARKIEPKIYEYGFLRR